MPTAAPVNLNERSNAVRQARADVRHALRTGGLTITTAMRQQPHELGDHALFEVLLMARNLGHRRLRTLNNRAIADGITSR
jgi:hypothetical protein